MRLGIAGSGWVTRERHLPALRRVPEVTVVAVADPDPAAEPGRHLPPAAERLASVEDLLERDLDAVAVCTPPETHVPIALAALNAGRHLLVEKPPALDVAEVERLVAAIPEGVVAACGFNLRGHPLVRRARELIRAGAVGEPRSFHGVFAEPARAHTGWRAGAGGGPLLDRALHHVDLWEHLLGDTTVESSAEGTSVVGRLAGGAAVRADAPADAPGQTVRVEGDDGSLRLDLYSSAGIVLERRRGRTLVERARAAVARPLGGTMLASYAEQWRAFAAGTPLATLDDGRRALAHVLGGDRAGATA